MTKYNSRGESLPTILQKELSSIIDKRFRNENKRYFSLHVCLCLEVFHTDKYYNSQYLKTNSFVIRSYLWKYFNCFSFQV